MAVNKKISIYDRIRYIGPSQEASTIKFGDIGYVIEDHRDGHFEVEFSNLDGSTKDTLVFAASNLERDDGQQKLGD